jgi:pimeloyl-ACP methyl ester carboxylesterase
MTFAEIVWHQRIIQIHYEWVGSSEKDASILVFLHEGLGSIAMWKQFPHELSKKLGVKGLVFSRPAYGKSTPRDANEYWGIDFLHQQAQYVLPAFLKALKIDKPVSLLGHSDGGSITLIYSALYPELVEQAIVIAPHIFVEEVTIEGIKKAKEAYELGSLKKALMPFHDDVDSAFYGWNDIWLNPEFKKMDLTTLLPNISAPLLAVQGSNDIYGTMAQVQDISRYASHVKVVELADCGHSPHRENPELLTKEIQEFWHNLHLSKSKNSH